MTFVFHASQIHGGLTDAMRDYATRELDWLDRCLAPDTPVTISVTPEGAHTLCVKLSAVLSDDHHIRMTERSDDFYIAMHMLSARLRETVNQHNAKRDDKRQAPAEITVSEPHDDDPIVRRKLILASPMTESAAMAEAERLGHAWFAFRDLDQPGTPLVLLYSRFAGGWGVAELK